MSALTELAATRDDTGSAPLPWGIDLLLTDACNLRCDYCPVAVEMQGGASRAFVDTRRAIAFLDSIAHFKPMVRLFGGEPFLHPHWPAIVEAAVTRGLAVTAVTNGQMLAGRGEELVRSGMLAIGISVDPSPANDRHRGDGTYAACEALVREIVAAKARLRAATPIVEIYTTVHEDSYAHLGAWADQLAQWGIGTLRLQHRIWVRSDQRAHSVELLRAVFGDQALFRGEMDSYCSDAMPAINRGILGAQLRQLDAKRHPFRIELHPQLSADEVLDFYGDAAFARSAAESCGLIASYAFVDPHGRLFPCISLEMGNVFDQPFEEVWNGERFRAFRRLLQREGRLPLCTRCPA